MIAILAAEKFLHDKVFIEKTVSPSGATKLPCGSNRTETIVPALGKDLDFMTVQFLTEDGSSEHAAASLRFLI